MNFKTIEFNRIQATVFILVIFVAIIIAEYIFVYYDAGYGIVVCLALALAIYIIASVIKMNKSIEDSAESLSLIPLYVLFTASLPWFFISQELLLPAVYSIILALCFWHMYEKDIDPASVGLKKGNILKFTIIGILIGFFTGQIEYLVIRPEPSYPTFEIKYMLRDLVFMTVFVGIGEELLFRGIIQNDLIKAFGTNKGILGQAFLFGIMHMTWRSPLELLFTGLAGLLFGIFYHKTGSLTGPIVFHGINNTMLVAILPYYYSGLLF
ncbi:MAG: CPBP family intramembrane glutamic endopeptidase [Methanolobus sp.]